MSSGARCQPKQGLVVGIVTCPYLNIISRQRPMKYRGCFTENDTSVISLFISLRNDFCF